MHVLKLDHESSYEQRNEHTSTTFNTNITELQSSGCKKKKKFLSCFSQFFLCVLSCSVVHIIYLATRRYREKLEKDANCSASTLARCNRSKK